MDDPSGALVVSKENTMMIGVRGASKSVARTRQVAVGSERDPTLKEATTGRE